MRLLAVPVLALVALGSGAAVEQPARTSDSVVANAVQATLRAGTARFATSNGLGDSGAIDLRNETAVSDSGWFAGTDASYRPLSKRLAAVLGITGKRWLEQGGGGYSLVDDPFLIGTRSLFDVIARAERVQELGPGMDRGAPVSRYEARVPLEVFIAALPPFEQEKESPGKPGADPAPTSWREYLVDYRGADPDGQKLIIAVDSQRRLRNVSLDLFEPLTLELYDYGVPVATTAPPAKEVISETAYDQLLSDFCNNPKRQTLPRRYPCQ